MLNTPFGTIKIIADGIMLDYEAIPFSSKVRSIVAKPLAGCYRIPIPTEHYHNIRCELEWSCEPIKTRVLLESVFYALSMNKETPF